jgi:meiotically up-regulated gene 157 (Mug157) protein
MFLPMWFWSLCGHSKLRVDCLCPDFLMAFTYMQHVGDETVFTQKWDDVEENPKDIFMYLTSDQGRRK